MIKIHNNNNNSKNKYQYKIYKAMINYILSNYLQ